MTDAHMFLQFIESKSPGTKQDTTFEQNVQENVAMQTFFLALFLYLANYLPYFTKKAEKNRVQHEDNFSV